MNDAWRYIEAEVAAAQPTQLLAYLHGATGDATISTRHRTVRFGQRDPRWLEVLRLVLARLSHRSWLYREGESRDFWILETTAPIAMNLDPSSLGAAEALAYVRGFFDAEGGFPREPEARAYVQFAQRDRWRIQAIRSILESNNILCGQVHVPSARVDPNYWRFYVSARSISTFINGWTPGILESVR